MKIENREEMQRAIGIVEGVSFGVKGAAQDALALAIEILDKVLENEPAADYFPKKLVDMPKIKDGEVHVALL